MENEKKVSVPDLLLRPELPDVRKSLPEKKAEVKRLTELAGEPVVFDQQCEGQPYGPPFWHRRFHLPGYTPDHCRRNRRIPVHERQPLRRGAVSAAL